MDNIISYTLSFGWLPLIFVGLLGLFLGWLLFRGKVQSGDLSVEGESQLRADADGLQAKVNELESRVGRRDTTISSLETQGSSSGDDESYALEWRNRYLAARVKYLEGRISEAPTSKKKTATKKKAASKKVVAAKKIVKKSAPKKATAKKAVAAKKGVKKAAPKKTASKKPIAKKAVPKKSTAKKATAKKVAPKKTVTKKAPAKKATAKKAAAKKVVAKKVPAKKKTASKSTDMDKYLANVRKYDAKAKAKTIENIVKYCGIALKSRDASLVACSDEKELDRIIKGFCTKKLGMTKNQKETVAAVCTQMKSERFKNRVTFYYLCAKSARKLGTFNL